MDGEPFVSVIACVMFALACCGMLRRLSVKREKRNSVILTRNVVSDWLPDVYIGRPAEAVWESR